MDKHATRGRDICSKLITPALRKAGRDEMLQIREDVGCTKRRILVRDNLASRGQAKPAHCILYFKPSIPLALIAAKHNSHSVGLFRPNFAIHGLEGRIALTFVLANLAFNANAVDAAMRARARGRLEGKPLDLPARQGHSG
jgi:hypothetical protein